MSRRKRLGIVGGSIALFVLGFGGAALATHTTEIETHVVPWALVVGNGVATGEVTITDTDALPHETIIETTTATVTETITVTGTETDPPPPAPQCNDTLDNDGDALIDMADPGCSSPQDDDETNAPPPTGACTTADTSGCVAKTTLNVKDTYWRCQQALASYGPLPVKVIVDFSPGFVLPDPNGSGAVQLGSGCVGDSSPSSIDLMLDVRGDGKTYGNGGDAVRLMNASPGAHDIQITGTANCGPQYPPTSHSDGIQAIGSTDITFVDFSVGDYAAGHATCQGAGGVVFYSGAGSTVPVRLAILRGSYIGCNHSLGFNPYNATGRVIDSKFRSGRNATNGGPAGECLRLDGTPFFTSNPCSNPALFPPTFVFTNVICERWNGSAWVNQ